MTRHNPYASRRADPSPPVTIKNRAITKRDGIRGRENTVNSIVAWMHNERCRTADWPSLNYSWRVFGILTSACAVNQPAGHRRSRRHTGSEAGGSTFDPYGAERHSQPTRQQP